MRLAELVSLLEGIAPPELAESMDTGKIGLIVKGSRDVRKVATALDPTPSAIKKAADLGADALVTHHTLIWDPVNLINDRLAIQLRLLLDNNMSLYSMHTNYDRAEGGVNDVLAELAGMRDVRPFGIGRLGRIEPVTLGKLAGSLTSALKTDVEFVGDDDKIIENLAVISGSGFREGIGLAREMGIDALLSSELRHDVILERGSVALLSAPHYHTEAPAMERLAKRLERYVPSAFIDDPPGIKVACHRV
jgi:dinuclear metal center YbgI/SA1388 family protein